VSGSGHRIYYVEVAVGPSATFAPTVFIRYTQEKHKV